MGREFNHFKPRFIPLHFPQPAWWTCGEQKLSHGGTTFMKKNYRISPRITKDADKVKLHHSRRPVPIYYCHVDPGKFTALEFLNNPSIGQLNRVTISSTCSNLKCSWINLSGASHTRILFISRLFMREIGEPDDRTRLRQPLPFSFISTAIVNAKALSLLPITTTWSGLRARINLE